MREADFTRKVAALLKQRGCEVIPIVASAMQPAGLPDRYVFGPKIPGLWLEFKTRTGRLREDQRQLLLKFERRGVPYAVARDTGHGMRLENVYGEQLEEVTWPCQPQRLCEVLSRLASTCR